MDIKIISCDFTVMMSGITRTPEWFVGCLVLEQEEQQQHKMPISEPMALTSSWTMWTVRDMKRISGTVSSSPTTTVPPQRLLESFAVRSLTCQQDWYLTTVRPFDKGLIMQFKFEI